LNEKHNQGGKETMSKELTFSIIKPDAVAAGNIGSILQMISDAGLKIKATKMIHMSREQAEGFYAVHKERPFFGELVDFMISGPVVVSVLEGENAIARYRELMGATNPEQAEEGTIRKKFATNIQNNAVHGSDAPETAAVEVAYFFSNIEMVG
jgi:nucleoside-diphosphate kinase